MEVNVTIRKQYLTIREQLNIDNVYVTTYNISMRNQLPYIIMLSYGS